MSGATLTAARAWFDTNANGAPPLPSALQTEVIQAMPANLQTSCARLMNEWGGERLRDSSAWQVRVLDRENRIAWLSLVCTTRVSDADMTRFRDERLVRLRLDDGRIDMPALAVDDDSRSGVQRVEADGHWPLSGTAGAVFTVHFDANPCCDGPESRAQTRTVVLIDSPTGVREALSIVTTRDNTSHSDEPEVDVETNYRADVIVERDASGTVTGTHATFRDRVIETTWKDDKPTPRTTRDQTGTLRYRWNAATLSFEPIK